MLTSLIVPLQGPRLLPARPRPLIGHSVRVQASDWPAQAPAIRAGAQTEQAAGLRHKARIISRNSSQKAELWLRLWLWPGPGSVTSESAAPSVGDKSSGQYFVENLEEKYAFRAENR